MSAFDKYHMNDLPEEIYGIDNDIGNFCFEDISDGMRQFYCFFDYLIETIDSTNSKSTYLRRPTYFKIINALKEEFSILYPKHIALVFEELCIQLAEDAMENIDKIVELWEELKNLMESFHESVAMDLSMKEDEYYNEDDIPSFGYNFSISNETSNDIQRFVTYEASNKKNKKQTKKVNDQQSDESTIKALTELFKLSNMSEHEIEENINKLKTKL